MGSKIRSVLNAPLHLAGWALVAGAGVICSLVRRDKRRQERDCKILPASYITRVTGSADGRKVYDCPRHG
jgi:hypothetical protein